MTPSARIQTSIELIDQLITDWPPLDRWLKFWFSKNRFVGSKDRRFIKGMVYDVIRHYGRLQRVLTTLSAAPTGRTLVLLWLAQDKDLDVASFFDDSKYGPPGLSTAELKLLKADLSLGATKLECPEWLYPSIMDSWGDQCDQLIESLNQPAPFDLRVNTLKTSIEEVLDKLGQGEITPYSPWGLRLPAGTKIELPDGWVEPQDEGSQLAALITEVTPGERVLDYCAGAGGKSLALAAMMQNQGEVWVHDKDKDRLQKAISRAKRAGVKIVKEYDHTSGETFDHVMVDAPCSGSGTWRRDPEAKWRLTKPELETLIQTQKQILAEVAPLVKPGGKLIYITCSLLKEENQHQVENFLAEHPKFRSKSLSDFAFCPDSGPMLLSPLTHGTDGFFAAVLHKSS